MDNKFVLETTGRNGFPVVTNFSKQQIEILIDVLWKKRWNKHIGMKFGIIYIEKYGREGIEYLDKNGIDAKEIQQKYEEYRALS